MRSVIKFAALPAAAILFLGACGGSDGAEVDTPDAPPAAEAATPDLHPLLQGVAAAAYTLDKTHAFLTLKVPHSNGLSNYRISLTDFDATLDFDPADPEASRISLSVNPVGIETNYPGDYKENHPDSLYETWHEDLAKSPNWLDAAAHPDISFVSTSATKTGDTTGTVTGDLTVRGIARPVTFDVTYNGVANMPWHGEMDLIGFDASTVIKRSDWGSTAFAPMVGDEISIIFSGEFIQQE